LRNKFARLAETLLTEGKTDKAIKVLDRITAMLPHERIAYDYQVLRIANDYLQSGQRTKGEGVLKKLQTVTEENLDYFKSIPKTQLSGIDYELRLDLFIMQEIMRIAQNYHLENISKEVAQ
jgi:DNA-binding SARP family transcriptional activator